MYNVSDAVIEAYKADGVHKEFKITINGVDYYNDQIVDDTFNLKQSILDSEQFEAVGCIASSFSIDLRAQFATKIKGGLVKVYVKTEDTNYIQLFTGYVDKCTKTANGWNRHIEAYDFLYNMSGQSGQADENEQKKYDITDWYNQHSTTTVSTLLSEVCSKYNLELATGNEPLVCGDVSTTCGSVKPVSNFSALGLLKEIMRLNGCFGYIRGDGKFSWKYLIMSPYDDQGWLYPSGYLYPSSTLYPGQDPDHEQTKEKATNFIGEYETLEYQDFKMLPINVVKVRNHPNDENAGSYGSGENSYIIEGNKLILDKDSSEKSAIAKKLYDVLNSTWYVPFTSNLQGLPYLECGDEVNFWDFVEDYGHAHLQRFYILNRTLSGGQHFKDSWGAEGNEYLHEFVSGEADNSSVDELRDEIDQKPDEEDVQEMIDNASGLYRIVSISPSEVPSNPDPRTLYCIQGECRLVEDLEPVDNSDPTEDPTEEETNDNSGD